MLNIYIKHFDNKGTHCILKITDDDKELAVFDESISKIDLSVCSPYLKQKAVVHHLDANDNEYSVKSVLLDNVTKENTGVSSIVYSVIE